MSSESGIRLAVTLVLRSGGVRQRVSHTRSWLQEMEALLGGAGALAPQARLMQRQRDAVKLQLRTMLDTVAAFHTHVLVRASSL